MSFLLSASGGMRRVSCPAAMAPGKDGKFTVPHAEYLLDLMSGIPRKWGNELVAPSPDCRFDHQGNGRGFQLQERPVRGPHYPNRQSDQRGEVDGESKIPTDRGRPVFAC